MAEVATNPTPEDEQNVPLDFRDISTTASAGTRRAAQGPTGPDEVDLSSLDQSGEQENDHNPTRMIISHFLTRMGDKMWEFIIPLALINISPLTLIPAALFGLVTTLARVVFGTSIGHQIDKRDRLLVVRLGIGFQALSVGLSGFLLLGLFMSATPAMQENIFATGASTALMVVLLLSASIGSLAALAMDVSIEKDWIPTAITASEALLTMNTRMRQIDLVTEVAGPFLVGIIVVIPSITTQISFGVVAVLNFLTFMPQYSLLAKVYRTSRKLQAPKSPPASETTTGIASILWGEWNPIANLARGWTLYTQQPVFLVSISFCLLWLTILSPHDIVFTSFLKSAGYEEWQLAIFRAVGAVFGVASTFAFPAFASKFGLVRAGAFYIIEEAICVLIAGIVFTTDINVLGFTGSKYAFLGFILLSRCGLYGFEVGEIQLMQQGCKEQIRGHVNSVEQSLTALASLAVFAAGLIDNNPLNFVYLIWGSVIAVFLGAVTYLIWTARWSYSMEEHTHDGEEPDDYEYHTMEQLEELKNNRTHTHGMFRRKC